MFYFRKKGKSGDDVVGETEAQKRMREADMCEKLEENMVGETENKNLEGLKA